MNHKSCSLTWGTGQQPVVPTGSQGSNQSSFGGGNHTSQFRGSQLPTTATSGLNSLHRGSGLCKRWPPKKAEKENWVCADSLLMGLQRLHSNVRCQIWVACKDCQTREAFVELLTSRYQDLCTCNILICRGVVSSNGIHVA